MIIAVEGPSAAGKTTWCRRHYPHLTVEEAPENIAAPDLYAEPALVARFWVAHNIQNWQQALSIEREHGMAVCDGDPLHLYFSWALWKSGALGRDLFDVERDLYGIALQRQAVGFADVVLWLDVSEDELRRRAASDPARRRKRHETYLSLAAWMKRWYCAREHYLQGTVLTLGESLPRKMNHEASPRRYEPAILSQMLEALTGD